MNIALQCCRQEKVVNWQTRSSNPSLVLPVVAVALVAAALRASKFWGKQPPKAPSTVLVA